MIVKIKIRRYLTIRKRYFSFAVGLLFVLLFISMFLTESNAAEQKTLTDISAPFSDDPGNHIPEETLERDGEIYYLDSYKIIDVTIPEQDVLANDTIVYGSVEAKDKIPATAEIEVTNSNTGAVEIKTVPLKEYQYTDYRWIGGFEFPVTVEDADAEFYAMGNELVPNREENPFDGYQDALLDFVGLDREAYAIENVRWTSEPWVSENGIVYRQALATGRKRVATVHATYQGVVTVEGTVAKEVQAFYRLDVTDGEQEQMDGSASLGAAETDDNNSDNRSFWEKLWDWMMQHKFITSLICILLLLLLVILILHILSRKHKEKREGCSDGKEIQDKS